ncbi:uncharacterized protein zc3h3 isoform 1-T1 [Aulostomus maculatus]
MEEREALKRQIDLLQDLINKHKSVHGDAPNPSVGQRHPEASTSATGSGGRRVHPHSFRGGLYAPHSRGTWRKTYSLSNKNPQSSGSLPLMSTSSSVHQTSSQGSSDSTALASHLAAEEGGAPRTSALSSGIAQEKTGHISSVSGIRSVASETTAIHTREMEMAVSWHENDPQTSSSTGIQHERRQQQWAEGQQGAPSGKKVSSEGVSTIRANILTMAPPISQLQIKPFLTSKTSTEAKQTIPRTSSANTAAFTASSHPTPSEESQQPSVNPATSHTSHTRDRAPFMKKSKFTWVKSQSIGGVEPRQRSPMSSPLGKVTTVCPTSGPKGDPLSRSSPSLAGSKRSPAKKVPRKLSPVIAAPKTSKYRWVSSSAGAQAKTSRKPSSPKALILAQKSLEKAEVTKRLKPGFTPSGKFKKGIAGSSTSSSPGSRYSWKAGGQRTSAAVAGGAAAVRRRSAFHWTSDKSNKGLKAGPGVSPTSPTVLQRASFPSSSPGGFKLRSRMKIIRKSAGSGCGSEKWSSPSASRHSPRGWTPTRTPAGVRRTPSRELVSFGRHKLRRLSPTLSRTSLTSTPLRSPTSQRVFRTRYKMVTRPGSSVAYTFQYNPALSWRTKRVQSARSFLQSRRRASHSRYPTAAQHWGGTGMCWIRGSLYRVSANKLSRTGSSKISINRTGRSSGSGHVSPVSPAFSRPSSTRHLASRAVQRSLAIIRHARQKKQQRQYCMYYNRFGKCNRGSSCPYIHDPDKVAVCTRFLRGTCKQAGTCPFSHKVAKEKMPVCSYFLKGICNNSDCPYSHVYVSRKAEVCEDFVKGYCPEGEKCKKKHTLVCPDFSKTGSCPQGTRCKLQHRQRTKRSASNTSTTQARAKEPSKRPRLSVIIPQGSEEASGTPKRSLELPSFISLSSSPEEVDAPDTPAETCQVKERKLQIKPRL